MHISGKENVIADYLSSNLQLQTLKTLFLETSFAIETVRKARKVDDLCNKLYKEFKLVKAPNQSYQGAHGRIFLPTSLHNLFCT